MPKFNPERDSLAVVAPDIAAEWHPTKNDDLTPAQVSANSHKKVWWRGAGCGHEWDAVIKNRTRGGNGCAVCSGYRVLAGFNDLESQSPDIAAEWHPTKNDLTPAEVLATSNKKAWWLGPCGHEWDASIQNRTRLGHGCPTCRGLRVVAGFNDLESQFPDIAKEWHPTKNNLTPAQVSPHSSKKAWWQGPCGHEYDAVVASRTGGSGCPVCAGMRVLAGANDLESQRPDIAAEWHPTKNDLTPAEVTVSSNKKVWWLGACGHEWDASINQRTSGRGCPVCHGLRVVAGFNDLGSQSPKVAEEWHPTKNGDLRPEQVHYGSNEKAWWLGAECGHEWDAVIASRTRAGAGCGVCAGFRVLAGFNDLGSQSPKIAAEWHPTKNGDLTPEQVGRGSEKKAWWLGACGHEWDASIKDRTSGRGCPVCAGKRILVGFNDLASQSPAIAADWHPTKNGDLRPEQVHNGSPQKVWWLPTCGHDEYEMPVVFRTNNGLGCHCQTTYWNARKFIGFVADLAEHTESMDPAMWYAVCQQAGILTSTKADKITEILSDPALLTSLLASNEDLADADVTEVADTEVDTEVTDNAASEEAEHAKAAASDGEDTVDEIDPVAHIPTPADVAAATSEALPVLDVERTFAMGAKFFASVDEETVEYLSIAAADKIWKAAYRLDAEELSEGEHAELQAELDKTIEPRTNQYEERIRETFRAEYDRARSVTPPANWSFRPGNSTEITQPNLMQKRVAAQIVTRKRVGNWSGTGAGKTASAILGAGLLHAADDGGIYVVICPNNVVDGWVNAIENCCPNARIEAKTLTPTWANGAGPRWLVLNYDRLPGHEGMLKSLITDHRVDMLVIDEVHFAKQRDAATSQRRQVLTALAAEAARANPELAVLGMSATPVVNNLREAVSLLEMIEGVKLDDLKTAQTVPNAMRIHQHLVRIGSRWVPEPTGLEFSTPEIDVTRRIDELAAVSPRDVSGLEQILLEEKRDTIVREARTGRKTLIYTQFVTGIVEPLTEALTAAGLRVGEFTGENKDGLYRFLGASVSGELIAERDQVDVLIGSEAIANGVDGLQHVCDTLVFASLPWTHANYMQIVGRLRRQGQVSDTVRVIIPSTFAKVTSPNGDVTPWSWCAQRWARVAMKETLSDCVVDGVVPKGVLVSPAAAARSSILWLRRLQEHGAHCVEREPLDALLGDDVQRMPQAAKVARYGELSTMNGAWATTNSATTHSRLVEDPAEWKAYHDLYRPARLQWPVVPAFEFAEWLNKRSRPCAVADLGCGEMLLADRLTGGHTVHAFDHVAFDDRVIACDIAEVPLDDAAVDIAVLSLALLGKNHTDYVQEAHRILHVDGLLWLCEPTKQIGADEARLREVLGAYGFNVYSVDVKEQFTFVQAIKSDQTPCDAPAIKLTAAEKGTT
jgi:superfamily II DNA or RNA helicase